MSSLTRDRNNTEGTVGCFMMWCSSGTSQVAFVVKKLPASAGDLRDISLIPGLGRSPGGGLGNSLQFPCLDRGAFLAKIHGVAKSQT